MVVGIKCIMHKKYAGVTEISIKRLKKLKVMEWGDMLREQKIIKGEVAIWERTKHYISPRCHFQKK